MSRALKATLAGAFCLGIFLGMTSAVSPVYADGLTTMQNPPMQPAGAAMQPPHDPSRKNAGEACKSSDECQKHHTCAKVGEKNICQAPPPPRLPPGVVT